MGRKRNASNRWLKECGLKYVTVSKNRYVYRPPPYKKETLLGKICSPRKNIIQAYDRLLAGNFGTLDWLLTKYINDRQKKQGPTKPLSPRTIVDYEHYKKRLLNKDWFGQAGNPTLSQIKRTSIRSYLDHYPSYTQARLHIQLIRAAWNWVGERYELPPNPCSGVKMPPLAGRKQFWADEQYTTALSVAADMRFPYMFAIMELQYLQGARHGEVLETKRNDCSDEGIHLKRSKGSKDEITQWTPRLRAVYEFCLTMHPHAPTPIDGSYLIHNKDGSRITEVQYRQACQRIKVKCKLLGVSIDDLHFHDIKANASMDRPDNDVGHLDVKMKQLYARQQSKPTIRKATR